MGAMRASVDFMTSTEDLRNKEPRKDEFSGQGSTSNCKSLSFLPPLNVPAEILNDFLLILPLHFNFMNT